MLPRRPHRANRIRTSINTKTQCCLKGPHSSSTTTHNPIRASKLESHLRNDQVFVDVHAQPRTLRQVEIAILVHEWCVPHNREPIGIGGYGRVVEDLNPRRMRPGGD